jgi:hypothetical protein
VIAAFVSVVAVEHYEPKQGQAEREARHQGEAQAVNILASERVAYYTKVLAIFTGALTAFGIVQLIFVARADQTASVNAAAALKSATAAEKSLRAAYQPLIVVTGLYLNRASKPTGAPHVEFGMRNNGRGEAKITRVFITVQTSIPRPVTLTLAATEQYITPKTNILLQVGEDTNDHEIHSALFEIDDNWTKIRNGGVQLTLIFEIGMEDIFGNHAIQKWEFAFNAARGEFVREHSLVPEKKPNQ